MDRPWWQWTLELGEPPADKVCHPLEPHLCSREHGEGFAHGNACWEVPDDPHAVLLYAHPDDEAIFASGLMLAYPDWRWTLVVATRCDGRMESHDRSIGLLRAAGVNVVGSLCLGHADEWVDDRVAWLDSVWELGLRPDVCFTHGFRGEYGHQHHIILNHIAHSIYGNVLDFYNPVPGKADEPQLMKGGVYAVPVDGRKREVFEAAYPEESAALWEAMPELIGRQMAGPELYTR